jgi:hypothetical protein
MTQGNVCGGSSQCNTHFNNCRRSIEWHIGVKGGMIVEREDGTVERREGWEEYIDSVLESMKRK